MHFGTGLKPIIMKHPCIINKKREMKKIILIIMIFPLHIFGQNVEYEADKKDSIDNMEVKVSMSQLTELENAKKLAEGRLNSANKRILEQEIKLSNDSVTIGKLKARISNLRADSLAIHNTVNGWKKQLLKADTCLINVASNFIYIPYEAYSVKEIAIPAFQMVTDEGLKMKYKSRYELLLKYKEHIVEFISCLTEMKKVLSNPFAKDAKDAIKVLHTKRFYAVYHAFEGWKSTFLGGKIVAIEKQLKDYKGPASKVDFDKVTNELQECLKTEDSL